MSKKPLTIDGLPVVDATAPLVLEVIKSDIDMRARCNPECCAISEAAKRETSAPRALTYRRMLYILHGDHWIRYYLSDTAAAEVQMFDRGGGFTIGEYRARVPPRRDQSDKHKWAWGLVTRTGRPRKRLRQVEGVRTASPLYGGAHEPVLRNR